MDSAQSDVLGNRDDGFLRARCRGSTCESKGASRGPPADRDDRGLWLIVWVPLLLSHPHDHTNWSETAETFAIAGSAWILADLLGEYRTTPTLERK